MQMKALFLGLGGIGQRHLRNLCKLLPKVNIGSVRHSNRTFQINDDLSADHSIDIVKKYKIKLFSNLEEAINWQPDFAVISTPSHYHLKPAKILVKNNIPILLEKPISHNWDGIDELVECVKKSKAFIMVGYMLRFHPGIQQLIIALKENRIGKIYSAQITQCSYMPSWHPYENYTDFYAGRKDYGGGVILTAIHPIDLIYAMFNLPVSLYAIGGKTSTYDIDVEDTVITLFDYDLSGMRFPVSLSMSFVERPIEHSISIWGQNGQLYWSEITGKFIIRNEVSGKTKEFFNENFIRNDMFIDEMKHFLDSIKNKKYPITEILDVIEGHKMALKIKESLDKKEKILFN